MTPADAARYMGLAEGTVRRMIAAGRLPIVRIGRATRIDRIKLDKLLDGGVLSTGD
jgi:excisionase family DNA binding protein